MLGIDPRERRFLLALARESIAAGIEGRPLLPPPGPELPPGESALRMEAGAFVSLHSGPALRGCIGRMSTREPLEKTVALMAREAALSDPRFPPLGKEELGRVRIEISVLSPPEPCGETGSIGIGVHGLWLIHRGRSGVFLPQVPVEQGWDLDQYLRQLCLKAGLPPGSHGAKGAELYRFTAAVFGEEPLP